MPAGPEYYPLGKKPYFDILIHGRIRKEKEKRFPWLFCSQLSLVS
jgi:hypothetical protein